MKRLATVLLVALTLSGCTATGGDADAARLAERVIVGIGDDITPPYPTPRDAEFLAAAAIESPRLPSDVMANYDVEALSWTGNSGDDAGALLEIRVAVHVPLASSTTMFGPSQEEGDATRCWRLTVFGYHDYDSLKLAEITCPSGPAPAPPTAAPRPAFPEDLEARFTAALADADPVAAVGAAFPDDYYSIQSASDDGETAVALGIPSELDCAVGVIHADGSIEVFQGFSSTALQPGEQGCAPDLYFHPVVTH